MAKNVAAPQVPGAPAAETPADPDSGEQQTADRAQAAANPEADGETVAVPKAQLDALLSRVAALETAQQQNPVAKRANHEADLPDQETIDPGTLKSPALSKQGWILPTGFGSNPAAKNL